MKQGDLLYVPRHFPHVARTHAEGAEHLTILHHSLIGCGHYRGARFRTGQPRTCDDFCEEYLGGSRCVEACDDDDNAQGVSAHAMRCACNELADSRLCRQRMSNAICTCATDGAEASRAASQFAGPPDLSSARTLDPHSPEPLEQAIEDSTTTGTGTKTGTGTGTGTSAPPDGLCETPKRPAE